MTTKPINAFISAYSGSGCTNLAVLYSRILSKFYFKKILYISFDPISKKMTPLGLQRCDCKLLLSLLLDNRFNSSLNMEEYLAKDDFNVSYFSDNSLFNPLFFLEVDEFVEVLEYVSSKDIFDEIVLDVPISSPKFLELCDLSENIIVNLGYMDIHKEINREFKNEIEKKLSNQKLYLFEAAYDPESFTDRYIDLYGGFAMEVRHLAEKIQI